MTRGASCPSLGLAGERGILWTLKRLIALVLNVRHIYSKLACYRLRATGRRKRDSIEKCLGQKGVHTMKTEKASTAFIRFSALGVPCTRIVEICIWGCERPRPHDLRLEESPWN